MEFTDDYISSIIGQAPGNHHRGLLLVSMLLVLIFYVLSSVCKCCGLCRCCFRPVPYTRKSLHVAKGIQLLFVLLCFCGCIVIYAEIARSRGWHQVHRLRVVQLRLASGERCRVSPWGEHHHVRRRLGKFVSATSTPSWTRKDRSKGNHEHGKSHRLATKRCSNGG